MKTVTHMHMSAFPSLSGRGLRPSSKSGRDWLEARVVPLPATGEPGQNRSAPPSHPCTRLVSLLLCLHTVRTLETLSGEGGPVQPGGLRRRLFYNGMKEALGVWGQGVGMQDEIRRACKWVRKFCEVERRGLCTQDALVQGSAGWL